jgi:hypothetical protein
LQQQEKGTYVIEKESKYRGKTPVGSQHNLIPKPDRPVTLIKLVGKKNP